MTMILRELIIKLQDLQDDGHGNKEVHLEGCDCIGPALGARLDKGENIILITRTRNENAN